MATRKVRFGGRATVAVLAALVSGLGFVEPRAAHAQTAPDGGEVDFDTFYRELSPHGDWLRHPRWGEVWRPNVDRNWRPYTRGHWARTEEYGWLWVAEEEWGWAPFHYGRWVFDEDEEEWLWIPGTEWAPAWVQWRESEDFIGWAPLPPDSFIEGESLRYRSTNYDGPRWSHYWVFVAPQFMGLPGLYRHIAPPGRWNSIYGGTRFVRGAYSYRDGRFFHSGVDWRRVERWGGRPLPVISTRPVWNPRDYGWRRMDRRTEVPIYRPRVGAWSTDRPRPQFRDYRDGRRDGRPERPRPPGGSGGFWGTPDRDRVRRERDPREPTPYTVPDRPAFPIGTGPRPDRPGGSPPWTGGRPDDGRPGDGRPRDGRPGDGRPRDGRPGDGRPGAWDQPVGPRPTRPEPVTTPPPTGPFGGPGGRGDGRPVTSPPPVAPGGFGGRPPGRGEPATNPSPPPAGPGGFGGRPSGAPVVTPPPSRPAVAPPPPPPPPAGPPPGRPGGRGDQPTAGGPGAGGPPPGGRPPDGGRGGGRGEGPGGSGGRRPPNPDEQPKKN